MVLPYYHRLSPAKKRLYRRSDSLDRITLPEDSGLPRRVDAVADALLDGGRAATELACGDLTRIILAALKVPAVRTRVMAVRPHNARSELHGLYERPAGPGRATITVWMRTAQRRQVVSFRTFLRTLLHECVHHLDYELFKLPDSLHTEGFFKRESSLMRQLTAHQQGERAGAGQGRALAPSPWSTEGLDGTRQQHQKQTAFPGRRPVTAARGMKYIGPRPPAAPAILQAPLQHPVLLSCRVPVRIIGGPGGKAQQHGGSSAGAIEAELLPRYADAGRLPPGQGVAVLEEAGRAQCRGLAPCPINCA